MKEMTYIRIDAEDKAALSKLAAAAERPLSYMVGMAVKHFLSQSAPNHGETQK